MLVKVMQIHYRGGRLIQFSKSYSTRFGILPELVPPTASWIFCSLCLMPPNKRQIPRQSNIFARIDPRIAALMIVTEFPAALGRAMRVMNRTISTTVLSKVSTAIPATWGSMRDSSCPAKSKVLAHGMMAMKLKANTMRCSLCRLNPMAIATGTKIQRGSKIRTVGGALVQMIVLKRCRRDWLLTSLTLSFTGRPVNILLIKPITNVSLQCSYMIENARTIEYRCMAFLK